MSRLPGWLPRLRLPVIAAPMFLLSGPEMVLAAARAGIVGAFPTLNARTADDLGRWLQQIAAGIEAIADDPPGRRGTWAANVVAHSTNPRLQRDLELLVEYKPPIVITALGSPAKVVEAVHRYGGSVIADVNSPRFARKAIEVGVDGLLLVASGAGGHTGPMSPFAFVETVREFWDGLLVLSGGMSTGRSVRAALTLGADMASLGTRFIVAAESMAPPKYKQMVVDSAFEDIVCTNAFTGAWANMLRPSIVRAGLDPDHLGPAQRIEVGDDPLARAWKDIWSAGHGVGLVRREQPLAEVVDELAAEFEQAALASPSR